MIRHDATHARDAPLPRHEMLFTLIRLRAVTLLPIARLRFFRRCFTMLLTDSY